MSFDGVLQEAGRLFGVHPRDIRGKARYEFIQPARRAFCVAMRLRGNSYPSIGRFLDRDHSTIIYAARIAEKRMAVDAEYRRKIEEMAAWQETPLRLVEPEPTKPVWVLELEAA